MHDMYLWFSVIGWAAAVILLILISLLGRRKRHG
jgi:hypothetical protein